MIVNIYLYQTIRGPGKKEGAYSYVLESVIHGEPHTKDETGILEPMSENKAELTVLLKALNRLNDKCDVAMIYGISTPVKTGLEEWLDKWIKADWKNARGKEIANISEWQQLLQFKNKYEIRVSDQKTHSYENWMRAKIEKQEQEIKNVREKSQETA